MNGGNRPALSWAADIRGGQHTITYSMNNRPDDPSDLARARSWRLRSVVRQWFVSSNQSVWWLTGSTLLPFCFLFTEATVGRMVNGMVPLIRYSPRGVKYCLQSHPKAVDSNFLT